MQRKSSGSTGQVVFEPPFLMGWLVHWIKAHSKSFVVAPVDCWNWSWFFKWSSEFYITLHTQSYLITNRFLTKLSVVAAFILFGLEFGEHNILLSLKPMKIRQIFLVSVGPFSIKWTDFYYEFQAILSPSVYFCIICSWSNSLPIFPWGMFCFSRYIFMIWLGSKQKAIKSSLPTKALSFKIL